MPLILAVDDSLDSIIFLQEFLVNNGYECRLATSGAMALDLVAQEKFDLIISDYRMEDGDGLWLLEKLSRIPSSPKCIIVTADFHLSSNFFQQQGADGFCFKPIIWTELKMEIERVLAP